VSAFNRSELVAQDDFRLFEFDATGEAGPFEYAVPLDERASAVVVLFEGEGGDADVLLDGASIARPESAASTSAIGSRRLLFKQIAGRVPALFVNARATLGSTLKISVLVIFRLGKRVWSKVSCPACKRFLRFLISALLVALGIPDLPADGLLPEAAWERLREFTTRSETAPDIMRRLLEELDPQFVEGLLEALRWLAFAVQLVFEPLDSLIAFLCKRLGFCH
jgi:hypothetical protein